MPTWTGWQTQFLRAAGVIVTPPNLHLLNAWANHAATNCARNPIDLSATRPGSSDCAALRNLTPKAQRYTSHASAAAAFHDELHDGFARPLLAAMNTGNPYDVDNSQEVANVFLAWGSDAMHDAYLKGIPAQTDSGSTSAPGVHKGWSDIRHSINKKAPASLTASHKQIAAALRLTAKARRLGF